MKILAHSPHLVVSWMFQLTAQQPDTESRRHDTLVAGVPSVGAIEPALSESLSTGRSKTYEYVAEWTGAITISAESFDFDVAVRVESADGVVIGEDDNGGVAANARFVFDASARQRYWVRVIARDDGSGEFAIRVTPGAQPRVDNSTLEYAAIEFYRIAAQRAHARGDTFREARYRVFLARSLLYVSRFEAAEATARSAVDFARSSSNGSSEAWALTMLGNAEAALGNLESAQSTLEASVELSRSLNEVVIETSALHSLAQVLKLQGQIDRAQEVSRAALAMCVESGNELGAGNALVELATDPARPLQYLDARKLLRRGLAIALSTGDMRLEAKCREALGNSYEDLGLFQAAIACFSKLRLIASLIGDRGYEQSACGALGRVYSRLKDLPRSRQLFERQFTVASEISSFDAMSLAAVNMGDLSASVGNYRDAAEQYATAITLARRSENVMNVAAFEVRLADALIQLNERPAARQYIEHAMQTSIEIGIERVRRSALKVLATLEYSSGALSRALKISERQLALAVLAGDRSDEASACGNLGSVLIDMGKGREGREYLERERVLSQATGNVREQAIALMSLGMTFEQSCEYASAGSYFEESLRLARSIGDSSSEQIALVSLGECLRMLGDYPRSLKVLQDALRISDDIKSPLLEVDATHALARTHLDLFEWKRAEEMFKRSLRAALDARDDANVGFAFIGLATVRLEVRDITRARAYANSALRRAHRAADQTLEANAHELLAYISLDEGDLSTAYDNASKMNELLDSTDREARKLGAQLVLARIALARGDELACRSCVKAAGRVRLGGGIIAGDDHRTAQSQCAAWGAVFQDLVALSVKIPSSREAGTLAIEDGFRDAGLWKSRILLAGIVEHWIGGRCREAIELRRLWCQTIASRDLVLEAISTAIHGGRPLAELDALRSRGDALLAMASDILQRLGDVSPRDVELQLPDGIESAQLQALLDPQTALVEYTEGQDTVYAYLVTRSVLRWFRLGTKTSLDLDCDLFASRLSSLAPSNEDPVLIQSGRRLYDALLRPMLTQTDREITRLIVVPTGSLARIPFDALPITDPMQGSSNGIRDQCFVIDRYEICVVPSSPVALQLKLMGHRYGEQKALILADPLYPLEATVTPIVLGTRRHSDQYRSVPETKKLERIPGSREEARRLVTALVGSHFMQGEGFESVFEARSGSVASDSVDVFLGADANPRPLAGDLRKYSILHLSGHGYIDDRTPDRTGLALATDSDANAWLTIRNVLDMDLDADIVVLPACETGRGKDIAGEGIQSLARAFMYSGARSVVASLWRVDDAATSSLVGCFYEKALHGRLSYSTALREAKLAMRRTSPDANTGALDWSHPSFWAGLIYIGMPN